MRELLLMSDVVGPPDVHAPVPGAQPAQRFWLVALFCNVPLLSAFFGFSIAQIVKFLLHFANFGRWDVTRLWGSGGMPSSHTAFVTGLSMSGEDLNMPCTITPYSCIHRHSAIFWSILESIVLSLS